MTELELRQHVEGALQWEPSVEASRIGVTVENGIVALRGDVKTFAEKLAAERIALRVYGVKAVANDLQVRLDGDGARTDTEIAQAAVNALAWSATVPKNRITIAVADGIVTLKGIVEWQYQKDGALRAVRDLKGVKGIVANITVQPQIKIENIRTKIEEAFKRSAEIDARRVNVSVLDGKVILSGNVHSLAEREEARRAAWAAPGVALVEDRLAVVP
jgi:osmotically-inducible protein OsmY